MDCQTNGTNRLCLVASLTHWIGWRIVLAEGWLQWQCLCQYKLGCRNLEHKTDLLVQCRIRLSLVNCH